MVGKDLEEGFIFKKREKRLIEINKIQSLEDAGGGIELKNNELTVIDLENV